MDAAIRTLRKEINRGNVQLKNVKEALTTIAGDARMNGLSAEHFTLFIRLFDTSTDIVKHGTIWVMALKCMLPQVFLPNSVLKQMTHWVVQHYRNGSSAAIALALQWLAGMVDYGLADEETVGIMYPFFFSMLEHPTYQAPVSWLMHKFTKPYDVERRHVVSLLNVKKRCRTKKNLDIVLWLFKILKPECVPETIPARSINVALRLPLIYRDHFERVQQHVSGVNAERTLAQTNLWKTETKKRRIELIPSIFYIHYGSSKTREKKIPLMEIENWKDMKKGELKADLPCHALSLLYNSMGRHLIAYGDSELQRRLSYNLFYTLHRVFIERSLSVPLEEERQLLEAVCKLQASMMQGLPVTGRFLSLYLIWWDGDTHLNEILGLLEWVPVSSYIELQKCILDHFYMVFMYSELSVKCAILRSLGNLARNLMLFSQHEKLFLHMVPKEDLAETVKSLSSFIHMLSVKGLIVKNGNNILLTTVLQLYLLLVEVEELSGLPVWSVLPPIAVYCALFSFNHCHLEMVCNILIRYKETTYPRLKAQYPRVDFLEELELIDFYVNDFMNLLWRKRAFRNRNRSYLFQQMDRKVIEGFYKIVNGHEAFALDRHVIVSTSHLNPSAKRTQGALLAVLQVMTPSVVTLLTSVTGESQEQRQ